MKTFGYKYLYVVLFLFIGSLLMVTKASGHSIVSREQGQIVLDNGNMRLAFSDGDQFKIVDIRNSAAGWLPEGGMSGDLWQLTLKGPDGVNPEIFPFNGIYKGVQVKEDNDKRASLMFCWQIRLAKDLYYDVRVGVSLGKDSNLSEWEIEADMPAGWVVSFVDFPKLMVKRTDTSHVIMPAGWGAEFKLTALTNCVAQYPSHNGGMQMMCMRDGLNTLYYATHDAEASIKTFRIKGAYQSAILSTEIVPSEAWTPLSGGTFRLPWKTSVGLCNEGWEKAVTDWYRPFSFQTVWGSKTFKARKLPQWVLNADMWLRPHFTTKETDYWLTEALNFFGAETACHWYRWHQIEYDVSYPEYFPPCKEFVPMMKKVQQMGSHVIPYINGRLWDPASDSYLQKNGKEASCRRADGTLYTEIYGSMVPNTITCPSSEIWQQIILDLTHKIQFELGTNGVYIDQVGAAAGVPCWAKNHHHPLGGGSFWHNSYRSLIGKVRETLPVDNILITEDNSECFMDLFDVMLMVNSPQGDDSKQVPLYPLVYSDRMMVNCFLYYPLTEKVNSMNFRMKNVVELLWGAQLGWVKPELIMAPEAQTEALFLREMVRFRRKQHDLIYGGRFIKEVIPLGDNPELHIPKLGTTPVVRGAFWIGEKGNKAILLVNIDDKPHLVQLPETKEIQMQPRQCIRIDL